ncbi:hypothetical protein C8R43DRAFT_1133766 [Mycena crocata]|nr:hypothetical protein C8R43DRAFT_1133766 [Mycena crocata]
MSPPVLTFVHPDAGAVSKHNRETGPSRNEIRSTVRSYFDVCSVCKKKPAGAAPEYKKCARCLIARYCSKACQVADWKTLNHKESCGDSASANHLKLIKRLVANNVLMFHIQLCAIIGLDLLKNPTNAVDNCLSVDFDTEMHADMQAYLHAMMRGETLDDPDFLLIREDRDKAKGELAKAGMGDVPLVLLTFDSAGSTILEVFYAIDVNAMDYAREERPSTIFSAFSGTVKSPFCEQTAKDDMNLLIRNDKTNQYLLRTKFNK